jgi:hypothetical protein
MAKLKLDLHDIYNRGQEIDSVCLPLVFGDLCGHRPQPKELNWSCIAKIQPG